MSLVFSSCFELQLTHKLSVSIDIYESLAYDSDFDLQYLIENLGVFCGTAWLANIRVSARQSLRGNEAAENPGL